MNERFTLYVSLFVDLLESLISSPFLLTGNASSAREEVGTNNYQRLMHSSRDIEFRVLSTETDVDFLVMDGEVVKPRITVVDDISSWNVGGWSECAVIYKWMILVILRIFYKVERRSYHVESSNH